MLREAVAAATAKATVERAMAHFLELKKAVSSQSGAARGAESSLQERTAASSEASGQSCSTEPDIDETPAQTSL